MEHYFSEKPKSKLKLNKINTILLGKNFQFYTSPGVFSKNKIDKGTKLLIEKAIIKPKQKILDLGCGYGVIAIVIKKIFPKTDVTALDINERAILLTKKNAKLNNVKIKVIKSNLFDNIKEKFDVILVNPPQKAGKELCFKIIEESKKHLKPNGILQLVARHNKGGKTLEKKMKEVFNNTTTLAKKAGYRVYLSKKQ